MKDSASESSPEVERGSSPIQGARGVEARSGVIRRYETVNAVDMIFCAHIIWGPVKPLKLLKM